MSDVSYRIDYKGKKLIENETEIQLPLTTNAQELSNLFQHITTGSGFQGHTPSFFAKRIV